jgi:tetratricopeptide (TPR) repeat protein
LALTCLSANAFAQELKNDLTALVREFDAVQFEMPAGHDKFQAFEVLLRRADEVKRKFPGRAEPLCWEGWVLAAQSETIQDLSMLDKRAEAMSKLQAAVAIDPNVYNGAPHLSLGDLEFLGSLFPFPLTYGGKETARTHYQKALEMNPEGLETNLHFAHFLYSTKDFEGAFKHASAAANAPPMQGRIQADKVLRKEAARLVALTLERVQR